MIVLVMKLADVWIATPQITNQNSNHKSGSQ